MKYAKKSMGGRMAAVGKAAPKPKKKKPYADPYQDPNHPVNRELTGPSTMIEKDSKTRKPKYKKGGMIGHNRLY